MMCNIDIRGQRKLDSSCDMSGCARTLVHPDIQVNSQPIKVILKVLLLVTGVLDDLCWHGLAMLGRC